MKRFGYPARNSTKYPTDLRYPHDPYAQEVHELGGKLIRPPLPSRAKFNAELEAHAPGCGSPIHVAGTNGGTMKCGATLAGKQQFCAHCDPSIRESAVRLANLLLDGEIDPAELRKGTKDEEEEHDMPPKLARKTARQHLTRVDPHYYTKTAKCLGEGQRCECTDPGCPACAGKCNRAAKFNINRADMEDATGVFFCEPCASDALNSGVFGTHNIGRFTRGYGRTPRIGRGQRVPEPQTQTPPKAYMVGDTTTIGVAAGGD